MFSGGPVAPNSALALALVPGTDEPVGWHPLDGAPAMARLGLVDLDAPPGLLAPAVASLRVYAGYAGWSAGQLMAEIEEGAWYVVPADPADAFSAEPDRLWPACCAARAANSPTWRPTRRPEPQLKLTMHLPASRAPST